MVVAFAVGEGVPNPLRLTAPECIQFSAFGIVLAGLLVGFRWEVCGGVAVLGGLAVFYATEVAAAGRVPGGASRSSSSPACSTS